MAKYIPTPAYADKMPIDISFVFEDEKPAGKHGFLKPCGEAFKFEDGSPARFWGTNFNGGACFPSHEEAEHMAKRVSQTGCNIVRFHQMDAEWNTPNIFSYSKGKRLADTRHLDPKSMDCLDYLIYCLKNEGVYVYLDNITYRKFKSGDGVEFADKLPDSAKPYNNTNKKLIELQKEFIGQLWTHVNPYTKLAYKDDPAICMTEITNESDLTGNPKWPTVPYYEDEVRNMFKAWLEKKGIEYDWQNCKLNVSGSDSAPANSLKDDVLAQFKIETMMDYYDDVYAYMRKIGIKTPITGTNWSRGGCLVVQAQKKMDFTDGHHYFYDWRWGEEDKICSHVQVNGNADSPLFNLGKNRVANKPYFVSEWDMPWPNAFRAEGSIYYAAVCALQNWSGMAIHTYAYNSNQNNMKILGKESSSSSLAGVPYREGIYSTWNDPAKWGLFYHSALMVRRADISPATKKIGIKLKKLTENSANIYKSALDVNRVALLLDESEEKLCDEVCSVSDRVALETPGIIKSDNGQLIRDVAKLISYIDTPRTKVFYGRLGNNRNGKLISDSSKPVVEGLNVVSTGTDFGVVALSSLTNDSTETSDNMLLSAIGRARNTDAQFDGDRMIDYGHEPILSEVIRADIAIKTSRPNLKVWGVNSEGYYEGNIPTTYEDGYLKFSIGKNLPAIYYLIVED